MGAKPSKKERMLQLETERIALEARNTKIIMDLLSGRSHKQLAEDYSISPSTVRDIIRDTRDQWKEWRVSHFDMVLIDQLERINRIENEAWDAYEKSKKPLVTQTRRTDGTRNEKGDLTVLYEEVKTQTRHADPRYLDRVAWCVEQRLKIMGGYAPEKHAATTPDGKHYAPFTVIEVIMEPEPKEQPIMIEATVESVDNA